MCKENHKNWMGKPQRPAGNYGKMHASYMPKVNSKILYSYLNESHSSYQQDIHKIPFD